MIELAIADICTAFSPFVIGSKVREQCHAPFREVVCKAIEAHDFDGDRMPGQGFIVVPDALPYCWAGDGLRTLEPWDYLPAIHRGKVGLYLHRDKAGEPKFCAVVVYTREAYLRDPEINPKEEKRIGAATHVLVAVLCSSGPESPLTPDRFVSNLAGGNREALDWTADEIREKAQAINDYWSKYAVVAG